MNVTNARNLMFNIPLVKGLRSYVINFKKLNYMDDFLRNFSFDLNDNLDLIVSHTCADGGNKRGEPCDISFKDGQAKFECHLCGAKDSVSSDSWFDLRLDIIQHSQMRSNITILLKLAELEKTVYNKTELRAIELANESLEATSSINNESKKRKIEETL